jgi:uncharacterized protein (DUF427 family)
MTMPEYARDYPRPPRVEPVPKRVRIVFNGETIADTTDAKRVLETFGAPVYYLPPADVRMDLLSETARTSVCEWKGGASYYTLRVGDRTAENVGWTYHRPKPGFETIADHVAFYCGPLSSGGDACFVGDERARPQPGGFYGGWVTDGVVGPFKGEPGTEGW